MCMQKITKYLMHAVIGTLKFNLEKTPFLLLVLYKKSLKMTLCKTIVHLLMLIYDRNA